MALMVVCIVVADPCREPINRTDCGHGSNQPPLKQGVFFENYLEDTSCLVAF